MLSVIFLVMILAGACLGLVWRKQYVRFRCSQHKSEREVAERKRVEEELRTSREQLRSLSLHLQSAIEEERVQIARAIHDDLGQTLAAMKMDVSWIKGQCKGHQLLIEKTQSVLQTLDATIRAVNRMLESLRPSVLDHLGLATALEWQAGNFQDQTGIPCTLAPDSEDIAIDRDRATAIFRIFQEALACVVLHASATEVRSCLKRVDDRVFLNIEAAGKEISEEELSPPQALGILGMRERIRHLRGEMKIESVENKGTSIRVSVPLMGDESAA